MGKLIEYRFMAGPFASTSLQGFVQRGPLCDRSMLASKSGRLLSLVDQRDSYSETSLFLVRERLLRRIDEALESSLAVLVAPPGFGKSVLVRQWAARRQGTHTVVLSDEASGRCALNAMAEKTRQEHSAGRFDVVIIDDRTIGGRSSQSDLDAFLRECHPATRCLVVTRPPGLTLIHRDVVEPAIITWKELAFTFDETKELFDRATPGAVSEETLRIVHSETKGWAAPLFLAALDCRDAGMPDGVLERMRNSRIFDEFVQREILQPLPASLREFFVRASIPDWLDPSICRSIPAGGDADRFLRILIYLGWAIERPVSDAQTQQFELVPILRHALRRVLPNLAGGGVSTVMTSVSTELAHTGHILQALSLRVDSRNWSAVIALVDESIDQICGARLESDVLGMLGTPPVALRNISNEHDLRRAYLHMSAGEAEIASRYLQRVECHPIGKDDLFFVNAIRSWRIHIDGDVESAIRSAELVLTRLEQSEPILLSGIFRTMSLQRLRDAVECSLARAHWLDGRVTSAHRGLEKLSRRIAADDGLRVQLLGSLALLESWAGDLLRAKKNGEEALRLAFDIGIPDDPITLDACLALANVAREQADEARALELLNAVRPMVAGRPGCTGYAMYATERALLHLSGGDPTAGASVIDDYRMQGMRMPPSIVDNRMRAVEVRLLLAMGESQRATTIVSIDDVLAGGDLAAAAVQASVAQSNLQAASQQLERWGVRDD
jgi:hypothetical protein